MKTMGKYSYFHKREEWKITDMLMNPMILMMVLPLLLITVLPKMMNDPETKREMEQMQANMNVQNQASNVQYRVVVRMVARKGIAKIIKLGHSAYQWGSRVATVGAQQEAENFRQKLFHVHMGHMCQDHSFIRF